MAERSADSANLIRVAIFAPSGAIRIGLQQMLGTDERIELVLVGSSLADLPKAVEDKADVVILTPGAARNFDLSKFPQPAQQLGVLLLAEEDIYEMTNLPVITGQPWGFLPADVDADVLTAAVRAIYEGLAVAPPAWLRKRLKLNGDTQARGFDTTEALTPRENEVLQQLATGLTNKQIAYALGISENTVKYHISSVYAKLGVMNRAEAVRVGVSQGWIVI